MTTKTKKCKRVKPANEEIPSPAPSFDANFDMTGLIADVEDFLLHAPIIPLRGQTKRYLSDITRRVDYVCERAGHAAKTSRIRVDEREDGTWLASITITGQPLTDDLLDDLATEFQQSVELVPAAYGREVIELWI